MAKDRTDRPTEPQGENPTGEESVPQETTRQFHESKKTPSARRVFLFVEREASLQTVYFSRVCFCF